MKKMKILENMNMKKLCITTLCITLVLSMILYRNKLQNEEGILQKKL
jgi:hypothetical protein